MSRRLFDRWKALPEAEGDVARLHPDEAETELLAKERRRFRLRAVARGVWMTAFLMLVIGLWVPVESRGWSGLNPFLIFTVMFIADVVQTIRALEPKVLRQRLLHHRIRAELLADGVEAAREVDVHSHEKARAAKDGGRHLGQLPSR